MSSEREANLADKLPGRVRGKIIKSLSVISYSISAPASTTGMMTSECEKEIISQQVLVGIPAEVKLKWAPTLIPSGRVLTIAESATLYVLGPPLLRAQYMSKY